MGIKLAFEKVMQKDDSKRVTRAESSILQQAGLIALRVTQEAFDGLLGRVETAESTIEQQANQIALRVTASVFNELKERVEDSESSIIQNATNIALRVAKTDYNGNTVASLINQSATTIKLQASKIKLEGLITANGFFKVLADGSIEAKNAVLSGSITATRMVATSSPNYYGEVGVTDGYVGFGLFDTRYGTDAYCEILEYDNGNSFGIRGKNNKFRFLATANGTYMYDQAGVNRIYADATYSLMYSPSKNVYIDVANNGVSIVKNGSVIASWGY